MGGIVGGFSAQAITIVLGILIGLVVELISKNSTFTLAVVFLCLGVLCAIAAIKRLPSLSASTKVVRALLALTVTLFMLASGAAAYAYAGSKEPAFSLTMNPELDKLSVEGEVSQFRAKGSVSGLGLGETIWVAGIPKKVAAENNIDEENLERAKVYPAFGPCIIRGDNWRCDKIYLTNTQEDHYILAYRVPSTAARDLVQYQIDGYSGQPNCQKGKGNFPPITMPPEAQLSANIVKFN
jgi:hypothetical protein